MDPRPALLSFAVALCSLIGFPLHSRQQPASGNAPPCSYAVLGRDPLTGEYGVAAASHAPLVGLNLDFLAADVGGVVALGGPYLQLNEVVLVALRDGLAPDRAIAVGVTADPDREMRQILALSSKGSAAFSGKNLGKHVSHLAGEDFVVAGHQLASDSVIPVMAEAFSAAAGSLTDRLLQALVAGRDAGGERDGEHSAALLVVGPGAQFATRDRYVDLRIDFVPDDAVSALVDLRARVDSVYEVVR